MHLHKKIASQSMSNAQLFRWKTLFTTLEIERVTREGCLCFITRNDQTLCFPFSYGNMLMTKVAAWYNTPLLHTTLPCETQGMLRWHCQARWLCSPLHAVLLDYKRLDHCAFSVHRTFLLINLIGRYRNISCSIETTLKYYSVKSVSLVSKL